jgi:putative ABC transport system permease protein
MGKLELTTPPKFPLKLLRWFCDPNLVEDVEGDVIELFHDRSEIDKSKARVSFYVDVLLLFRPGIIKNFQILNNIINFSMVKNFLKIAFRNAIRYKGYTLLNLLGLVVGIVSSILIILWVNDEVGIDKFHTDGNQIHQLFRNMKQSNGVVETTTSIPKPAADLIKAEYPDVKDVAAFSWEMTMQITYDDKATKEKGRFATPSFLNMFSFPFIAGDEGTALNDLNSIVISQSVAEKHFGKNWKNESIGKIIKVEDVYDASSVNDVVVTGVFEDIGDNSTLKFDWLQPAQTFYNANEWVDDWGNGSFGVYITIPFDSDVNVISQRMLEEINTHTIDNDKAGDEQLIMQQFEDTYLYSNFDNGVIAGGRITYVRIMTVVALLILFVACINFMNLTTARANRRVKEIGLRKVMGAQKQGIRVQFFLEAFLFTAISVILSLVIVMMLLPFFNELVGKSLFVDFYSIHTWYFLIGITLIVGLLSGSYPAILLPAFNIIQSLKGGVKQSVFASYFRKSLVIFQFAISMLLIIGTAVIYKQINYVMNKDLGLDKENLVAISMKGDLPTRLKTYKTELARVPGVKEITTVSGSPINYGRSTSSANWEGKDPAEGYEVNVIITDEDFIETMGMKMISGRDFMEQATDSTNFIINEVAAELMGFEDPIGKKLSFWGIDGTITGVVKNFHMQNLYKPIAPLIITCIDPSMSYLALVRINGDSGDILPSIEKVTKTMSPSFDFEYEFIDQAYEESYAKEKTVNALVNIFAIIAIFISCLGIYGLASYSAEQRSREIGVRKVHGSSVQQILFLLSKDYAKLMILAFVLAIPFGYYITQNWLNNFEFRTSLDPIIFLLAGISVFLIGIITVAAKSYSVATVNPVNSLKEE